MIDEKRIIIPTTCLECAIQIVAFREDDPRMNSIHITSLSSSYHWYNRTFIGRLRNVWNALKGNPVSDIDLMVNDDIAAFRTALSDIYTWLYDKNRKSDKHSHREGDIMEGGLGG